MTQFFKQNLFKLHIVNSLESLAWSLVGIFIPIFLLTVGYSLVQVFIYYIIQNIAILIASFLVLEIAKNYSLKVVLLFRFPLVIIFLYFLSSISDNTFPIYLLAIVDGIQAGFFYLPIHIIFSNNAKNDEISSSTAKFFAIPSFIGLFGPLIGGIIIYLFGFKYLFLSSIILLFFAYIPLFFIKLHKTVYHYKLSEGKRLYKKYKKYFYYEIFSNIAEEVDGVIWPIFIYINLINITSVGIIGSIIALSSSIFTLIVGKLADKKDKLKMIRLSVVFLMLVWLLRYLFHNETAFYILSILASFAYVIFSIPYYSIFYKISKKEKEAVFFAFREVPVAMARIIMFVLAIILANQLELLFIIAALSYIIFLFWKEKKGL